MDRSVQPHGGKIVELVLPEEQAEALKNNSGDFVSITLTQRQSCDLELLLNGGFSPLEGFMNQAEYDGVLSNMTLQSGAVWPIPIVLDIPEALTDKLKKGDKLALRDAEGFMPAVLTVGDIWKIDKEKEAEAVYGTASVTHPGVRYLKEEVQSHYVGGTIEGVQLPTHYEFESLWDTPTELRHLFHKMGWRNVVAFQTSKPMHRVHRDMILKAAKEVNAHILLHPTVGMTKPGDLNYYARVHCYQAIQKHFPKNLALLSLLPMAMRMAGPREALWHGIVQQNFGCSHFIVGPSHASPPANGQQEMFYADHEAQNLIEKYKNKIEIQPVMIEAHQYAAGKKVFMPISKIDKNKEEVLTVSDAEIKSLLSNGESLPEWFTYPEVELELKKVYPQKSKKGFTLFFTGLSGAGKSTLAKIVYAKLIEQGGRPVTLLDGDIVRNNLSSELGFSKEHRNLNVTRIGFVASEITKNGGVAICAPIAPYHAMRRKVREMIEECGSFIEIHVATPLETCEARDRKGLYAKARKGIIPEFTGISDPYEVPENPELRIDTSGLNPMEAIQEIYLYLIREGYLDQD